MFQIVMCLEQRVTSVEFHEDTPYGEQIARERPSEAYYTSNVECLATKYQSIHSWKLTEDDFRRTIMPCTDDARMKFVVKRRTTEIDQPNLGISQDMLGFRICPL